MNCSNLIDWGYYIPASSTGSCAFFYNQGAQRMIDVHISLNKRYFKNPLSKVLQDGGSHVPAQQDVVVQNGCRVCGTCPICDCSSQFLRFPFKSSVQARWVHDESSNRTTPRKMYPEAVIVSRYDDHNPFFHLSLMMNAWSIRAHLTSSSRTIMVLGEKVTQKLDSLWSSLFNATVLYSDDLPTPFSVHNSWFVRSEYRSPIMHELDAHSLRCHRKSVMIQSFFSDAIHAMGARASIEQRITFIRRQHYQVKGKYRTIGRRLVNENKIIKSTRRAFPHMIVEGVFMEGLEQRQQISLMQRSKFVIGMHGAGMVNVGFMNSGGVVIEIFPRLKRRYGYRNICAYLGIEYHEYRGGIDRGPLMDKIIDVYQWDTYLRQFYSRTLNRDIVNTQ